MSNSKGSSSIRSMIYNGKNPLLPPKSPFPSMISSSYTEYIPRSAIAPKPRGENPRHQRTSSESFLDEQPSWLDELLNEPETPVRKGGHRRSSSDSFAYTDTSNGGSTNYHTAQDDNRSKNITSLSSWGSQNIDFYKDVWADSSFYPEANTKNKLWDSPSSVVVPSPSHGFPSPGDNVVCMNSGSLGPSRDVEKNSTYLEAGPQDPKGFFDKESFHVKSSASETDTKRTKQQYAQRSRVRKLQYIAELERNAQALQAEGSEASAELEFMNQRNLILSLENKTLKQRLESLSQEKLIKCSNRVAVEACVQARNEGRDLAAEVEHEVLEREAGRLRTLYQQQQKQQPLSSSGHRRAKSRDLDQQFSSLSIKHKETGPGQDSISSQLI